MDIPMHRFKYTKLTKSQIVEKLRQTVAGPKCASELSDVLRGKSFKIVTKDGLVLKKTIGSGLHSSPFYRNKPYI